MRATTAALLSALAAGASAAVLSEDVPTLPVPWVERYGHTNVVRISNGVLEAYVLPALGRLIELRFRGEENLFRLDTGLIARAASPSGGGRAWVNAGGDWIWPVAQERWAALGGANWPPPAAVEPGPWSAAAWQDAQGAYYCLLTNFYGPPLNLAASRLFRLDPAAARLVVQHRLQRTAPSDVPVVLWQLGQVAAPDDVMLPVDAASQFPAGWRSLGFTEPAGDAVVPCSSAAVFRVRQGGEHKAGSDSARAWVAARRGGLLMAAVERTETPGLVRAEQGCRTTFYSNTGLGYAEAETLSDERNLKPGERIENTVELRLFHLPPDLADPCSATDWLRARLGETDTPAPPR